MIHYKTGNLLDSEAEALVNTVNTVGVMGKGIALQFKNRFPNNFKLYAKACKNKELNVGQLLVTEEEDLLSGKKIIINFPTKTTWRLPSEYQYIESGLTALVKVIEEKNIKSIAIPPLGAGNGGLDWNRVKPILEKQLAAVDSDIYIYEPNAAIQEVLKKERVKLTPARAMLLSVLYELVRNGEFVSEFSAEKIAYFLQRFGAKETFKLEFQPNFYGPYSGKVKHVLYYLNGSYLMGYSSKDKKPFEELSLITDTEAEVEAFLNKPENAVHKKTVEKTKAFLSGYYSPFGLELLSTIDYIISEKNTRNPEAITRELENWSGRKKTLFTNPKFVEIAIDSLEMHLD
ncbi:macro domain-containing protein [Chryseobacterium salipaludis]|uniref:type II toxin-antitoxin system antitoxin DNA ADP-ribosyl glycohydrolase DarG n=1 Tax=Chryseobacterium TaxID=59732 RepID=UPI001FF66A35|nr:MULTISPECIES: macro domain-containing protein [Chryseobacterium]MCJ8498604.1 macro domain-containing protein [Chryseobacterium salipaludis]MCX3297746.1 macro domain-containing protein [Planobacterium sp. JC490]